MIRIFEFDALKPEEILNRDIRAEASLFIIAFSAFF